MCWANLGSMNNTDSVADFCNPLAISSSSQGSIVTARTSFSSDKNGLTISEPNTRRACSDSSSGFFVAGAWSATRSKIPTKLRIGITSDNRFLKNTLDLPNV